MGLGLRYRGAHLRDQRCCPVMFLYL
uniref:Uncharacterized protein n=1 Tax=Anguilla anguilla TaxID=7936 RepID=A0A0E9T9W7_ANGAN